MKQIHSPSGDIARAARAPASGILHLTSFLQGGAGRCITDLALGQRQRGAGVTVVTSATGEAGYGNYPEYIEQLIAAGVRVESHDSLFKRDLALNLAVVDALRQVLPVSSIDIIHAHAAVPALAGLLVSRQAPAPIPVVQTMHGWGTRKTEEQRAQDLAVMRLVDRVITTSSASRDLLVGMGLHADHIVSIPCGLAARAPQAAPPDDLTRDLTAARTRGAQVLVCIGSVTENKNQRLLVDVVSRVSRESSVFCAFIGEGPLIEELMRGAADRSLDDVIRFYGHRPNAAAYIPACDVLVLPSRTEGQGLAVLEAFRAGVLAVVSDIPTLTELVTHGRTGLTFVSDNADALAAAIHEALSLSPTDRERMTNCAQDRFAASFMTQAMLDAHHTLYARLIARRP
jgi:L-malate glycosyltransferase